MPQPKEPPLGLLVVGILLTFTVIGAIIGVPMIVAYIQWDELREYFESKEKPTRKYKRDASKQFIPLELLPREMEITYQDAVGDKSVRVITVQAIEKSGRSVYIRARCHLRKAQRTFKLASISKAVDTSTGEIIDLKAFRQNLESLKLKD